MASLRRRAARAGLPSWEDDLTGEWRAVELHEDMDAYEERRAELEKLADGAAEFAYRTGELGVELCARVSHPYESVVGLRPGPEGYMGKHVPPSNSHNWAS